MLNWSKVCGVPEPAATPELPDGGGWLMIEVGGDDDATASGAEALIAALRPLPWFTGRVKPHVYGNSADGAGLGSQPQMGIRPGGLEDAAVPPEHWVRICAVEHADGFMTSGLAYGHLATAAFTCASISSNFCPGTVTGFHGASCRTCHKLWWFTIR